MEPLPVTESPCLKEVCENLAANFPIMIRVDNWPEEPNQAKWLILDIEKIFVSKIEEPHPTRGGKIYMARQLIGRFVGVTRDGEWELAVYMEEPGGPITYTRTHR